MVCVRAVSASLQDPVIQMPGSPIWQAALRLHFVRGGTCSIGRKAAAIELVACRPQDPPADSVFVLVRGPLNCEQSLSCHCDDLVVHCTLYAPYLVS